MASELLISTASVVATVVISVASLAYWLGKKFAQIDTKFRAMEAKMDSVARATRDQFEFFAEFLGYRGVLDSKDVSFVKGELARLARANPLTEAELRRIRELVEKEELTLEEADELRELARRFVEEHGDRPGAWKLLIYASIMRGIALRKLGRS